MSIYLRQIALVAEKLEPVLQDLQAVFGVERAYVDPEVKVFGLENTLLAFGTNFLEVVAPVQGGTAAGRYLKRRGGDGGYMVIAQADSRAGQDAVRANAAAHNVRVAWEMNSDKWRIMQLHPGDMRASFYEVDWDSVSNPTGHWGPAGGTGWEGAVNQSRVGTIIGAELQGPNPEALAAHWGAVSGLDVERRAGVPHVPLANGFLRFVRDEDGRGPGLGGMVLKVTDKPAILESAAARGLPATEYMVTICGTRFYLEG